MDEDIKLDTEPQEWYDSFIEYAKRVCTSESTEQIEKFYSLTYQLHMQYTD